MNVVDSSGWIEFFNAGPNGPVFKAVIEQRDQLLVPVIALYEVHKILSRKLRADQVNAALNVMRLGRVIELTDSRAIAASHAASTHKLAMADAAMYSIAQEFKATFWTQDADYSGLAGVNFFPSLQLVRMNDSNLIPLRTPPSVRSEPWCKNSTPRL